MMMIMAMMMAMMMMAMMMILIFTPGADHLAGGVPGGTGGRDGSQAPPLLVGGVANPGSCPAQYGGGGTGELP